MRPLARRGTAGEDGSAGRRVAPQRPHRPSSVALALLTVGLLSACPAVEVPPGRYTCDPSGDRSPRSSQCPGETRCGLEGFCHTLGDTSTGWRCATAEDCEGGFLCGLSPDGVTRQCHDPAVGADLRCDTSADCAAAWICGLDAERVRRCHDPAAPRAWPCASSQDCVGGWTCGFSREGARICHDPTRPEAWPCFSDTDCVAQWTCRLADGRASRVCRDTSRPSALPCLVDADCVGGWTCRLADNRVDRLCRDTSSPSELPCLSDTDCAGGFRCGLATNRVQRECHDPAAPRAFACAADEDCLGGWRCDVGGACADLSLEALRPTGVLDAGRAQSLSSSGGPFDRLARSRPNPASPPVVAFERAGRLQALFLDATGPSLVDVAAAPRSALIVQSPRSFNFINNQTRYVEVNADRLYTAKPDGGLRAFTVTRDGGVSSVDVEDAENGERLAFPVAGLRHPVGDVRPTSTMVGFSSNPANGFFLFDSPDSVLSLDYAGGAYNLATTPNSRVRDMVYVFANDGGLECLFVLATTGLWVGQFAGPLATYPPEPVHTPVFGNEVCGPGALQVTRVVPAGGRHLAVGATPRDGGAEQVAVWDISPMFTERFGSRVYCTSLSNSCAPGDAIPYSVTLGPCEPCLQGQPDEVVPVVTATRPELEVRCVTDGGSSWFRLSSRFPTSTACDRRPVTVPAELAGALRLSEQAMAPALLASSAEGALFLGTHPSAAASLSLDRAPSALVTTDAGVVAIATGVVGVPLAGLGLVTATGTGLLAGASNEPGWALSTRGVVSLDTTTSPAGGRTLALTAGALSEPLALARATTRTGAAMAIVTSGTQLLSEDVSGVLAGTAAPSPLQVRTASAAPFVQLAFPARLAADAGVFVEGLAVTTQGALRVLASGATRFRLEPVTLPGLAQEAWYEGSAGRVGVTTGAVYAVPSRVRLVPDLPGGEAVDFVEACGHQLALSRQGVYRVVAGMAGSEGRWESVPIPGLPALDFQAGSLHAVRGDLFVFTASGQAFKTTLAPCP